MKDGKECIWHGQEKNDKPSRLNITTENVRKKNDEEKECVQATAVGDFFPTANRAVMYLRCVHFLTMRVFQSSIWDSKHTSSRWLSYGGATSDACLVSWFPDFCTRLGCQNPEMGFNGGLCMAQAESSAVPARGIDCTPRRAKKSRKTFREPSAQHFENNAH